MKEIMEEYSNTFIKCVKDWPEDLQEDIFKLYAYLRVCDEMVEGDGMKDFAYWREVISEFYKVHDKYEFDEQWLIDFHKALSVAIQDAIELIQQMEAYGYFDEELSTPGMAG